LSLHVGKEHSGPPAPPLSINQKKRLMKFESKKKLDNAAKYTSESESNFEFQQFNPLEVATTNPSSINSPIS
jgi:hypothetical protein